MPISPNAITVPMPNIVRTAFVEATGALRDLARIGYASYVPPEVDTARAKTEDERMYEAIAEKLAWGLRVADSFDVLGLITAICSAISPNPGFEYYVVYSFLSIAYENENALRLDNYFLNPLTPALKSYALSVVVEYIRHIHSSTEMAWLVWIVNRVIAWLPLSRHPETYIDFEEAKAIFKAFDRQFESKRDESWAGAGARETINQARGLIERYKREREASARMVE